MNRKDIIARHRRFVLDVVGLCDSLPRGRSYDVFARQVIRSASSVGANYRAAGRAKSTADFINKLKIVEEESDESAYWLDLIGELKNVNKEQSKKLMREAEELLAMTVAAIRTAKSNIKH